ncbi:CHASE3 domain-containing protein [Paenibacillus swuensis]|nr:CHASE3 domain-containing protein [Paenibacillus swuensis]
MIIINNQISHLKNEQNYIISHDIEVHNLTYQIEKQLLDMETGQRGYVITGATNYLEPYNSGRATWKEYYNDLYTLISDNPNQKQKLSEIKSNIESWINVSGEPVILLKQQNKMDEILAYFDTGKGKMKVDEVRTQFKIFRDTELELTEQRADRLNTQNRALEAGIYILLALVCGISIGSALFISNTITKTIRDVIQSIRDITSAGGNLSHRIQIRTRDEVGELGDAMNVLLETTEQQSQLKTNIAEIIGMFQGMTDVKLLGQSFLNTVAPMMSASYGVLYLRCRKGNGEQYLKVASYATNLDDIGLKTVRIGEGLVGQSIMNKQVMELNDIPEGYVRIASALGQAEPKHLIIVPVEFEGSVIAAVELATFGTFIATDRQLLLDVSHSLGTALDSVETRMEIERLLEESQVMTEELQVQTEELQVQAEEMERQQEVLQHTNNELEKQNEVNENKSRELEITRVEMEEYTKKLQEISTYKSNFLANMSHELRTPLNSMLVLSQLLAENRNGTLTVNEQEYARVVNSAGNDLLVLINDVLDLSKVEAGKIDIVTEITNVTEIPIMMRHQFLPLAEQKGIEFHVEMSPDVPDVIWTDEQRLYQIIRNLLSNAFKFTSEGQVTLSISMLDDEDYNRYGLVKIKGSVVAISVKDTGIGIPHDKLDLIFEAFQQVDGATSRKYGGTGLGLSISREFAHLLGGVIVVESEERVGSTFTFLLQLKDEDSHQLEPLKLHSESAAAAELVTFSSSVIAKNEPRLTEGEQSKDKTQFPDEDLLFKNKRVLIVDDDIRNTFALTVALEQAGLDITVADNGQECMEILQREPSFDIILMDIMMPVMDGYETMRNIRKLPEFEGVPVIALTAKAMKYDREKCLAAGASDYISKPLNMDQLFSLMRVWLTS